MPGEEGYPAYLAAHLAAFYERAGRVVCGGAEGRTGSVTIVGAVSPPGGDFSEPMTQNSLRVVGTFWGLDYDLSRRRHFPAINWISSFTLYDLQQWYKENVRPDWYSLTSRALALLQEEAELQEIVQLVGPDALAEEQRAVLLVARMLREDFLQQSAFHEVDRFCSLGKAYGMLRLIMSFADWVTAVLANGLSLAQISQSSLIAEIARMKEITPDKAPNRLQSLWDQLQNDPLSIL
jgi:V/A-type H+-transporting ATPase subunit A